jgi:hypothetical protein
VEGVSPHRRRLDDHERDALAPRERARAVDLCPDAVELVDAGVALLEERRPAVDGDPDDVDTVNCPRMNTPSSGATRGSPRSFTVANATCFVPWR